MGQTIRASGNLSRFLIRDLAMGCLRCVVFCLAVALCVVGEARAQVRPGSACGPEITAAERAAGLPPQVLGAIGVVESGRVDPRTGLAAPWPWTINVAGVGHVFDNAADAIAAVQAAQAAGVQSIDVGCMQINLMHHPHAFATLQDAFDPAANVRYAAGFLARLHGQTGNWGAAIAAYHSATPALGLPYARTVALVWPLALRYGLTVPDPAMSNAAASTRGALELEIDPYNVLTPEFRARLVDAALQRHRELENGAGVLLRTGVPTGQARPAIAFPDAGTLTRGPSHPAASDRLALENEVDPRRVLTPEFRAEMVAVARSRHGGRGLTIGEDVPVTPAQGEALLRRPSRPLLPAAS